MTKKVIQDYFAAFRWGKVKEFYKNGGWFTMLYMLVIIPMIMLGNHSFPDTTNYYLGLVPIMFCLFSAPLCPLTLPKIMYLCPMSETERREYIRKLFLLKLICPVGIAILIMSTAAAVGMIDAFAAGIIVLETLLLGSVLELDAGGSLNWDGKGIRKPAIKELEIWLPAAEIIGVMIAFFSVFLAIGETALWEMVLIGVVILLLQLPLTIKVMRYYGRVMDSALHYENNGARK